MTSSPRPGVAAAAAAASSTPSHPAHTLLSRSHSPDTASRIFTEKLKNKPLLVNPTASATRDKRALRRHIRQHRQAYFLRKRKPQPLSAKEKRQRGVFKLKKEEIKYEIYRGLHRMWVRYMLEVLGFVKEGKEVVSSAGGSGDGAKRQITVTAQYHGPLLASADFHGAEVEVVRCGDVGKVGIRGIVVRDTKYTFVVVTRGDEVKVLPKRDTVFRYEIPLPGPQGSLAQNGGAEDRDVHGDPAAATAPAPVQDSADAGRSKSLVFELHGNQFEFRPADRANRKFKWKVTDYL